ncbi:MAG: 2-amino-4-hydroxy-6-hydroxymethyldihydropteridine pyrophosphokinase [Alphaproteobacteria bacterium BRH_c36]|nr:MAG: 2-amino-4-hydroxy-6-hydroxymethyldihydropteridine pyrophosphokinase [Alphaproteobacteria bacterium BRH_c36]
MVDAVVALGSNIGDKVANVERAVELLTGEGEIALTARSRIYKTPPWGNTDQDWFVNACIGVRTGLDPHALLTRCLSVEEMMGRRRAEKWGPRIIDLDVLVYGDVELADEVLTLPHPHITKRAFVLAPMADIVPDLMLEGRSVAAWLSIQDLQGIEPIE